METKQCRKCGLVKPLSEFRRGAQQQQKTRKCGECRRQKIRDYRNRPEVLVNYQIRKRQWLMENPERRKVYAARRAEIVAKEQAIRLDKLNTLCGFGLTLYQLETISYLNKLSNLHQDNIGWKCSKCEGFHSHCNFFDVHHITPRCEGGSNAPSNLQILCPNCHRMETISWLNRKRKAKEDPPHEGK
jgi:5-methylcytosine-specific restriction endonuclease McrA